MSDTYPAEFNKVVKVVADIDPPTGNELACDWGNPQACKDDNTERAAFAGSALRAYVQHTGGIDSEPVETVLGDLFNDLRHLCDALDLNYEALASKSLHYDAEIRGTF